MSDMFTVKASETGEKPWVS